MAQWIRRTCARIRRLAVAGSVTFTTKAAWELEELGLLLDQNDARTLLASLSPADFDRRLRAHDSGEWLYVVRPMVAGRPLYVKLALRSRCIVVSFHDEDDEEDDYP
jgi:hypothetical protein